MSTIKQQITLLLSYFLFLLTAPAAFAQVVASPHSSMVSIIMLLLDDSDSSSIPTDTIAHWTLDDQANSLVAKDTSSNHLDGAYFNTSQISGHIDDARQFNGVDDYLSLPFTALHNKGDVTISLWFKTSRNTEQTLLSGAEQHNTNSSRILLKTNSRISYYTSDRSWERETWTVPPFDDNQWHKLVIVRNDTLNLVTLYLDDFTYRTKSPGLDLIDVEPRALLVGLEQDRVGGTFDVTESFMGEIDDIHFYNQPLSRKAVENSFFEESWHQIEVQIDRSSDDAEGSNNPNLTDWDLDINETPVGLRFNHIGIPTGAIVEKAYVEFYSNSTLSTNFTVPIYGELSANASTFSNSNQISTRPKTNAHSDWTPIEWSWNEAYRTSDLTPVIQEIVNQSGWAIGNSLALLFEEGITNDRRGAMTYDYRPEDSARLVVYFSGGAIDVTPPTAPTSLTAVPSSTAITLTWNHAADSESGLSNYRVYRHHNSQASQLLVTLPKTNLPANFTDTTVTSGITYTYQVRAVNQMGIESALSNSVSATAQSANFSNAYWSLDQSSGLEAPEQSALQLHGTLLNNVNWSNSGKQSNALVFDGIDDALSLPARSLNGAQNLSIGMWFKTSKAARQALLSGFNTQHQQGLFIALEGDEVEFHFNNDSIDWDIKPIDDNQWHHLSIAMNGEQNAVSLYIDGEFIDAQRLTIDQLRIDDSGLIIGQHQTQLGSGFTSSLAYQGTIDEIHFDQHVLSWIEVQTQVVLDASPPSAPASLAASIGDGSLVDLSWVASVDAETDICKYRIYRGATAGFETFLFEVGNVITIEDTETNNNEHYSYQVSAVNCIGLESARSSSVSINTQSDSAISLQSITTQSWDETAVRRVLHIFAYGGHSTDAQIMTWANMAPATAITQMLTFGKTNALLSPADNNSSQHAESLLALQNFWGGQASDNPMRTDKREYYASLAYNNSGSYVSTGNFERAWTQAITTRGVNPFLHKMAFFLSNYQMAISQFKTRTALIRDYYDSLLHSLSTQTSFVDVINRGAKHATVARAYAHDSNRYYNDTLSFRGNDDFAREYFQLFFAIQGETEDPLYHEGVTIENNAMLLTGMVLDRQTNAYGSDSSGDWRIAPLNFTDHIDASGNYLYNQSNHHANCLEILHEVICGDSASTKLDALSPIAANHAESLANLPLYIINLFADDNITAQKQIVIQAAWRESNFNLLQFLRDYAISTIFHSADTYKNRSSFDRSLTLFNLITLDSAESFVGLDYYENVDDWLNYQGLTPFNPTHDVFGHQTGLEAVNSPNIFKQSFQFQISRNTLQKSKKLYYLDEFEIDATTWYKDWGATIPINGNGDYQVSEVANWLWNRLVGDGGKNFDIIAKAQVYALLARGRDFGLVAVDESVNADLNHVFTSVELNTDVATNGLLTQLGTETLPLASSDVAGVRRNANIKVGQAVQFIAMMPYTFVIEGQ